MKTRIIKKLLAVSLVLLLISSLGSFAFADGPEYTISMACSSTEKTNIGDNVVLNFNYAGMLAFKNYVESSSSGRIQVDLYTNSALGNASEILLQCMQGVIEVSTAGDGDLSNYYPNLQLFSIPYTFADRSEFYKFLDSDYVASINEDIAKECGIRIISAFDNGGFRNFSNNIHQIKTADDVKGLNIRCMQSAAHLATMEALGAVPQSLAFSELYSALQTGVVDGQENAPLVMLDNSIYEQQKYYSLDGHMISPCYFIVNEAWYQALPADLQEVIINGGKIAETAARGTIATSEGMALTFLSDKGVDVYSPTPAEKETFKVAQAPVIEWLKGQIGSETVDTFTNAVASVKEGVTEEYSAVATQAESSNVGYIVTIVVLALVAAVLAIKAFKKKPENT